MTLHQIQGVGCRCTTRELPNATTQTERVTCRRCLRLIRQTAIQNAGYLRHILDRWGTISLHMRRHGSANAVRGKLCRDLLLARFANGRLRGDA